MNLWCIDLCYEDNFKRMNKIKIKVDVVSDVVCPWCYIGKRRLEKAIATLPAEYEVEVSYLPFELNPDTPQEGHNQKEYLSAKFGGEERYRQITGRTAEVARQEGLDFAFDKQEITPNTLDAHRLILLARTQGADIQHKVKEAFMSAYFEKGIDLSSRENLLKVAEHAGLDRAAAGAFLQSGQGAKEVRELEKLSYQRGISGVPFYIVNNKYGVSGAQSSETFLQIFKEVGAEVVQTGEYCEPGKEC